MEQQKPIYYDGSGTLNIPAGVKKTGTVQMTPEVRKLIGCNPFFNTQKQA
ncbi:hypothetical protein JOC77_002240 [Peribacillus deserti]|uniref:Uncharacterized protein n=1 Tax=Peribacillus deserti TaxID=673318 RepID=A0ABS2QJ93_9BACI|nr:hypothetical protein [Peribacillus deserti]MBM7692809.1 hypothetical protein [Peribacillus deserti]